MKNQVHGNSRNETTENGDKCPKYVMRNEVPDESSVDFPGFSMMFPETLRNPLLTTTQKGTPPKLPNKS